MIKRIELHRQRRPIAWITKEETLEIGKAIQEMEQYCDVILLDCLTLWISNLLTMGSEPDVEANWVAREKYIIEQVKQFAQSCQEVKCNIIIVGSEVGMSIVPGNRLARLFRDLNGITNQEIAKIADEVYLVTAGIPIEISLKR
ncbi:hypothetical protein N752_08565 [Desulforamulus aquiferis]|nr:bifunctional adenosylcobinamide kinase/adenosylcobinamide-phosphate guanylyltransferase [Desulforamulus aquiferis]RYD05386.1 hypothetical protein N752_08565 [Desulforamulus aquiferis]